jgi:hypothetical protein
MSCPRINYLVRTLLALVSLYVMPVHVPRHTNYHIKFHRAVPMLPSNLCFRMSQGLLLILLVARNIM